MKRKKTRDTPERVRYPIGRRRVIRTLAVGAGGALLAGSVFGGEDPDPPLEGQYYVWDDGYGYPIVGFTAQEGWWVAEFDDGEWAVNPAGHVFDSGFWYPVNETDEEGVYFDAFDGYIYLHVTDLEYVEDVLSEGGGVA